MPFPYIESFLLTTNLFILRPLVVSSDENLFINGGNSMLLVFLIPKPLPFLLPSLFDSLLIKGHVLSQILSQFLFIFLGGILQLGLLVFLKVCIKFFVFNLFLCDFVALLVKQDAVSASEDSVQFNFLQRAFTWPQDWLGKVLKVHSPLFDGQEAIVFILIVL